MQPTIFELDRRQLIGGALAVCVGAASTSVRAAPPGDPIANRLAHYAARLTFTDIDAATLETGKIHLVDALGCLIAAYFEDVPQMCRRLSDSTPGSATILGSRRRTSPELAAFANGAAIRHFDLNDVYAARETAHPSDNFAACLAVAESERRSPRDFILASVLAYEIECRLCDAAAISPSGWDHPTYSSPACALAAGRLMGLDEARLVQAINFSIVDHIALNQTRVQELSNWKGVADADAARSGLFAAALARTGMTGPAPIFEGEAGLEKQVTGPMTIDIDGFGGRQGRFRINDCFMKYYPAQGHTLTAAYAAVALRKEIPDLNSIESIAIATTRFGYESAGRDAEKWRPATRETADHSLPYVTARALLDGGITIDSYSDARLHDPAVLALMRKITVAEDPALTALYPRHLANRLTVKLADGRVLSRQMEDLPGSLGQPMTRADVEAKFWNTAAPNIVRPAGKALLDFIWAIERATDLAPLARAMADLRKNGGAR